MAKMGRPKTPLDQRIASWLRSEARWIKRREISQRFGRNWLDDKYVTTYRMAAEIADNLVERGLVQRREYVALKGQRSFEYKWIGGTH